LLLRWGWLAPRVASVRHRRNVAIVGPWSSTIIVRLLTIIVWLLTVMLRRSRGCGIGTVGAITAATSGAQTRIVRVPLFRAIQSVRRRQQSRVERQGVVEESAASTSPDEKGRDHDYEHKCNKTDEREHGPRQSLVLEERLVVGRCRITVRHRVCNHNDIGHRLRVAARGLVLVLCGARRCR